MWFSVHEMRYSIDMSKAHSSLAYDLEINEDSDFLPFQVFFCKIYVATGDDKPYDHNAYDGMDCIIVLVITKTWEYGRESNPFIRLLSLFSVCGSKAKG